jgi:acetyl-CoA synthetase
MPQEIEFVPGLPKIRSGKIMRRVLRAQEWGEEIGDTAVLRLFFTCRRGNGRK